MKLTVDRICCEIPVDGKARKAATSINTVARANRMAASKRWSEETKPKKPLASAKITHVRSL